MAPSAILQFTSEQLVWCRFDSRTHRVHKCTLKGRYINTKFRFINANSNEWEGSINPLTVSTWEVRRQLSEIWRRPAPHPWLSLKKTSQKNKTMGSPRVETLVTGLRILFLPLMMLALRLTIFPLFCYQQKHQWVGSELYNPATALPAYENLPTAAKAKLCVARTKVLYMWVSSASLGIPRWSV